MSRPKVYKTEAIILRQMALGEADRILTFYTPDLGKVRAVAKGVRRPSSKMGGHLEVLSHVSLLLARGQNLDIVTQAHLLHSFSRLREDLDTLSRACYLADLVDAFSPEEAPNPALYDLLMNALRWLEDAHQPELLLRSFELHLLAQVGYRPQVHACVECQQPLAPQDHTFSLRDGGVICPSCRHQGRKDLVPISLTALKVFRYLLDNTYPQARRLQMEAEVSQEVERLLARYIRYQLEREVRSAGFLERLESWRARQPAAPTNV